ncbi:DUF6941 family protein [Streptomyces sp. L7]
MYDTEVAMRASLILCDYAQVHAGKLYVTGGGVNLIGTPSVNPPHPISIHAAVILTVPWQAHNQAHTLRVRLEDEDGTVVPIATVQTGQKVEDEDKGSYIAQFNVGRPPIMQAGDENPVPVVVYLGPAVPKVGGYKVSVSVDGAELATARFRVMHFAQENLQLTVQ